MLFLVVKPTYGGSASFPLTLGEADSLEKVQRRASKHVKQLRHLSYEERLRRLDLFSLHYRRLRGDLITTWRVIQGHLGDELRSFFLLRDDSELMDTRSNGCKLFKPRRSRLSPNFTLSTRIVNEWNSLPRSVVLAATIETFKLRLDQHYRALDRCFVARC